VEIAVVTKTTRTKLRPEAAAALSLQRAVDAAVSDGLAPGAAGCVVHRGVVVAEAAAGTRDAKQVNPMAATTKFDVASQTKLMSTLALLRLWADDRIDLQRPIDSFFPTGTFLADRQSDRATVADCLRHEAGFSHIVRRNAAGRPLHACGLSFRRRRTGSVRVSENGPIQGGISAKPQYSNVGAALLAELIEMLTRRSYPEAIDDLVLQPLGMSMTSLDGTGKAEGFRHRKLAGLVPELFPRWVGIAGGTSTVRDLGKLIAPFTTAGQSPFLPERVLLHATNPAMLGNERVGHVFGWRLEKTPRGALIHQAGTRPGLSVKAMVVASENLGVVILANAACRRELHSLASDVVESACYQTHEFEPAWPGVLAEGRYVLSGSPARNPTFWLDCGRSLVVERRSEVLIVRSMRLAPTPVVVRDGEVGCHMGPAWVPLHARSDAEICLGGPYTGLTLRK